MEEKIKVYIKINENNEIIEVGSSVFIEDFSKWIYVDEGIGDKFAHAQNQYLENPIVNDAGFYNYTYENGKIIDKEKR